jgi:alcohol dehydrogenase
MEFETFVPTRLVFGAGRLADAGKLARPLGRRALVVTSRNSMDRLGYTARLLEGLVREGIQAAVFRELGQTPNTETVDRASEIAREMQADFVIGLGGGSALDCAKAVAGVATTRIPSAEFLHARARVGPDALPLIAIPTTAGTGSEMNRSAILTDPAIPHKNAIRSDHLFPRIALVDPLLTHDLPPEVTAQTGFDVLAHAIESYVSPKSQPFADALAIQAMAGVVESLPRVLADPYDAAARERLAFAATSMGYNLACVGTCLPHRLDKPVCALFPQIAHGQAVAFFYKAWARYSWPGRPERFARIAALLESTQADRPIEQAAMDCADTLESFIARIGLGRSLSEFDVNLTPTDVAFLAKNVAGDLRVNPVPIDVQQLPVFFSMLLHPNSQYSESDE